MALASRHPFKVPTPATAGVASLRRMNAEAKSHFLVINVQKILDNLTASSPSREVLDATRAKYPHIKRLPDLYAQAKDDLLILLAQYTAEYKAGEQSTQYAAAVSILLDNSRICKRLRIL